MNDTREKGEATGELPPALSDITVNVPGHAYLPEEYIPDADTRVLWYRKLASAPTVEDVATLREELRELAPEMPDAAANLFERAWLKAFANEHGVKVISVVGGKLLVDPIDIPREKMTSLRRAGGRYAAEKRKLSLPLRYFSEEERGNLMPAIVHFLEDMFGEKDTDEEVPFAEMEGAAASEPAASSATATAPKAASGKGAKGAGSSGTSASRPAQEAASRPTARSERRAGNVAKGEAARERLAAKRAARAAKKERGES